MSRSRRPIFAIAIVISSALTACGDDTLAVDLCSDVTGYATLPAGSLGLQFVDATAVIMENASTAERPRHRRRRRRSKPYKAVEVSNGGTIIGTILYKGELPEPVRIAIVKDHATCSQRRTEVPKIRTDSSGHVAEAVVFMADITRGKAFVKREKPPVIDQHFCTFVPHVQAVRVKEPVEIVNNDDVAHNINVTQRIFTLFNILQPLKDMKAVKTFDKPGLIQLRCNVHNWMHGYVHVFNHPYYQVTAGDGSFRLENVPAGEYELVVWQEYLGEQVTKVVVKAGETSHVSIELKPISGESSSK